MRGFNVTPGAISTWLYNQQTSARAEFDTESLVGCGGCAPDEIMGRGPLEGALINPGTGRNVEYATGEEVFTFPVLSVPGVGLDLDIWLTYRSRRDFDYRYGQSWNLNQDVRLESEPNSDLVYHNGYGRLPACAKQRIVSPHGLRNALELTSLSASRRRRCHLPQGCVTS